MHQSYQAKPFSTLTFAAITFFALIAVYYPHLPAEFIGDDTGRIEAWGSQIDLVKYMDGLADRPLLVLSLWFDRHVLGLGPFSMRVESLAWLTAIAVTIRHIAKLVAARWNLAVNPHWRDGIIFLATIHPIHIQTVGHVVQRGVLMSFELALLATVLLWESFVKYDRSKVLSALLVWILALLCKPNTFFMPIVWIFLQREIALQRSLRFVIPFVAALAIPISLYAVMGYNSQRGAITPWNYFLIQGELLPYYLRLLLVPLGLKFNHDFTMGFYPTLLISVANWLGLVAICSFLWLRVKPRITAVFFLSGVLAFLPESSFFPIMHNFFEHRASVPFLFLALGASTLEVNLTRAKASVLAVLIMLYASLTVNRTLEISSFKQWAMNELRGYCETSFAYAYMGMVFIERNDFGAVDTMLGWPNSCGELRSARKYLTNILAVVRGDQPSAEQIAALDEYLNSDAEVEVGMQNMIDKIIIRRFPLTEDTALACPLEELFANQLRRFRQNPQGNLFRLSYYLKAAKACLKQLPGNPSAPTAFQAHKIRTIQVVYFSAQDPQLLEEVTAQDRDPRYAYLKELLTHGGK